MSDVDPFDWQSPPPTAGFKWAKNGQFRDGDGAIGRVGSRVRLRRPAISFDEKGTRKGVFSAGEIFTIDSISLDGPILLYIEGISSSGGYEMAGVQPDDAEIVTGGLDT